MEERIVKIRCYWSVHCDLEPVQKLHALMRRGCSRHIKGGGDTCIRLKYVVNGLYIVILFWCRRGTHFESKVRLIHKGRCDISQYKNRGLWTKC